MKNYIGTHRAFAGNPFTNYNTKYIGKHRHAPAISTNVNICLECWKAIK